MMAKAIAKSVNASFLYLRPSTIQSKWFGESQKFVRAVFSLAKKVAPTIIFIDEIDCFLQQRGSIGEHETSSSIKAEFMTLWDGLLSEESESFEENNQVMIIAATNRPMDVDEAILRRLPRRFEFSLPSEEARLDILKKILRDEDISQINLQIIARLSQGYSGSDLKEVCRFAVMLGLNDQFESSVDPNERLKVSRRQLKMSDFAKALEEVKATVKPQSYHKI
jgi:SpoVK/Ycf46/Vps4 family AAA+-type ATPase